MQGREILIYLSMKYEGDWNKMVDAIKRREEVPQEAVKEALKKLKSQVVTLVDPLYPSCFKNSIRPPIVIYYYGDINLLNDESKCVAYVGSRDASEYGLKVTDSFCEELGKDGYNVVSGLARGIDAKATEAALRYGKAVGILGSGIDLCYPSSSLELYNELKNKGLVLSEYPGETKPVPEHFPERNRLVAASSQYVIVGEAGKRSGTLITVNFALSGNKDIGCVPYEALKDSSCNLLIRDGAYLLDNLEDLREFVNYHNAKA
jgi:DNA processing protein